MLLRLLKTGAKWLAIYLVGGFLLMMGGAYILMPALDRADRFNKEEAAKKQQAAQQRQQEFNDGWSKWADEMRQKNKERANEPPEPGWKDGFTFGYSAGMLTDKQGAQKLGAKQIDALSREGASKQEVPDAERAGWQRGFSTGWDYGWQKGK